MFVFPKYRSSSVTCVSTNTAGPGEQGPTSTVADPVPDAKNVCSFNPWSVISTEAIPFATFI
jgi:hypothetical protein